jgi:L-malate glycosyltransferase
MSAIIQFPVPVLFTHYGDDWIRGSEILLLDLLKGLNKDRVLPIVWCNGRLMAQAARDSGYTTFQSDFRIMLDYGAPKPNPRAFWHLVRNCRALCRAHGIKALHANSAAPMQWLVPAGCSLRLPTLAHLHISYLRRSRYAFLLHAANLLVGVSHQVISGPAADGMAPECLRVIYNGIDLSRLSATSGNLRQKLNIPDDAIVVASAGSLILRKGHDVLIRSFHALPSRHATVHLILMGDGPERKSLEDLALSLGIADRIHFMGHTTNIAEAYSAANLFALASRGDAFGLVLAEAGHFGLPVVATSVGGIPEVVLNEETGLLVPPDDVPAFSSALARLITDPKLRERLGASAAERVSANFTVPKMALQFEDAYMSLAHLPASQLGWAAAARRASPSFARLIKHSLNHSFNVSRHDHLADPATVE